MNTKSSSDALSVRSRTERQQTEDRITRLKSQMSYPGLSDIRREKVHRTIGYLERCIQKWQKEDAIAGRLDQQDTRAESSVNKLDHSGKKKKKKRKKRNSTSQKKVSWSSDVQLSSFYSLRSDVS
jgi:hypothetical protein